MGVCGNVCCVAAVVKNSVFFSLGVLKYVVCLCRGCDGCQGLLDHPLRQLEVSLSAHRVSHRGVQTPSTSHTFLDTAVVTGDVIRVEVLWTLKVVMCHYSFNLLQCYLSDISSNVS